MPEKNFKYHIVKKDDNYYNIAKDKNISLDSILKYNPKKILHIDDTIKYKESWNRSNMYSKNKNNNLIPGTSLTIPEYGSDSLFLDFNKKYETYKKKAYKGIKGEYTVGYGNTYLYEENPLKNRRVTKNDILTKEEAEIQHARHINYVKNQLSKKFPNFNQFFPGLQYALIDLVYNVGETNAFTNKGKDNNLKKAIDEYAMKGDYNNLQLLRNIAKHLDFNLNTEGNLGIRAGSRKAMVTGDYDWNDNELINSYNTNPKESNYFKFSPYWLFGNVDTLKFLQGGIIKAQKGTNSIKDESKSKTKYYGKRIDPNTIINLNGPVEKLSKDAKMFIYNKYNPGGTYFTEMFSSDDKGRNMRAEDLRGTPEEEAYWAAYLELPQDLLKSTTTRKPVKETASENSVFIGTPPNMDLRIQAIADTLNTGILSRLTEDKYKLLQKQHPNLVDQDNIKEIYHFGKRLLDNPKTIQQANENLSPMYQPMPGNTYYTGLGALQNFGMYWDNGNKTIYAWDTYDFPWLHKLLSDVPDREKPLEIRSKIKMYPEKGSKILNEVMSSLKNLK